MVYFVSEFQQIYSKSKHFIIVMLYIWRKVIKILSILESHESLLWMEGHPRLNLSKDSIMGLVEYLEWVGLV